jgi:hypothetical protein
MVKKYRSDLEVVRDLVTRGRAALGLAPLERLPKGVVDDPFECPLGRALEGGIGQNGCTCYCPEVTAHFDRRPPAVALKAAYGTSVRRGLGSWAVRLPEELARARFNHEFNARAFPDLIDRDCLTIEEAARRLKCRPQAVQDLISQGLVPAMSKSSFQVYVHWSVLKSRLLREGSQPRDKGFNAAA